MSFGQPVAYLNHDQQVPGSASVLEQARRSHLARPHSLAHQISTMSDRIIDHDTSRIQGLWDLYTQTEGHPNREKEIALATGLSIQFAERSDQEALQFLLALVPDLAHHSQEAILVELIENYLAYQERSSEQTLTWFLETYSIAPLENGSKIFQYRHLARIGTILANHTRTHPVTYQGARVFYLCHRSPDVILLMCDRELPVASPCFRVGTSLIYSAQIAFRSELGRFQMIRPGDNLLEMTRERRMEVSERLHDGSFSEPILVPIPQIIADA